MKILIVEDDVSKASVVREFIVRCDLAGAVVDISDVDNLSAAVQLVSANSYDLIILDLMLPYLQDGDVSSTAGLELLRRIRAKGMKNENTPVVGLSAYPDEIGSYRSEFERHAVIIANYSDENGWTDVVRTHLDSALGRALKHRDVDFLIFVALDEELEGFRSASITVDEAVVVNGLNVRYAQISSRKPFLGAIVRLRQMGLVPATLDVALALAAFNTNIVAMSGICAGFSKNSHLGQVVFASPAWEYQAGKWSDNGFEVASYQIPMPPPTKVIVEQAMGKRDFTDQLESGLDRAWKRPTKFHPPVVAPAATGSAVIADADRLRHIEIQHRKVAALDMETFGLYYASHESVSKIGHFFSAKCVVDLADSEKGDDLHAYGSAVAARCVIEVIRNILA